MKQICILFLLLIGYNSHAQEKTTALVFEGAGIRGIAYAGAVQALEEQGALSEIEKFAGTSAGAIVALLLALDYKSDEIFDILGNTAFESFNDGAYYFPGGLYRLKNQFGWYKGEQLNDWLGNLIQAKTGNADISFQEFKTAGYPSLYCVATCVNKQKMVILSHETYPKMKLRDAVHISAAIPIYYRAVFVDQDGHVYDEPANGRDVMVDGGLLANYPIFIFDEVDAFGHRICNPNVKGIRIDEDEQIAANLEGGYLIEQNVYSFDSYVESLYILVLETINRTLLTPDDWDRTISISSVGIGPKVRKLTNKEKSALLDSGYKGLKVARS